MKKLISLIIGLAFFASALAIADDAAVGNSAAGSTVGEDNAAAGAPAATAKPAKKGKKKAKKAKKVKKAKKKKSKKGAKKSDAAPADDSSAAPAAGDVK